jgi:hypothetical protein
MVVRPGPMWRDVPADAEPFDWPAVTPPPGPVAAGEQPIAWKIGTFSLGVDYGREQTDPAIDPATDLGVSLAWRLQALPRQLWLRVVPEWRRFSDASSIGGRADALLRLLGPDVRFVLSGRYRAEDVGTGTASGGAAGLRVYRPFRLENGAFVIPSLEGVGRLQSGNALAADPDVYSVYAGDHPFALRPEVLYWAMPTQDTVGFAGINATTNPNVASLDQAGLAFVGRGLVHAIPGVPFAVDVHYRPTWRFADADRAAGYLRHTIGGEIGTWIRLGEPAGLWIGAADDVYAEAGRSAENIAALRMRVDLTGGRALDDMLPVEQDFFDLLASERWGALDEDGP